MCNVIRKSNSYLLPPHRGIYTNKKRWQSLLIVPPVKKDGSTAPSIVFRTTSASILLRTRPHRSSQMRTQTSRNNYDGSSRSPFSFRLRCHKYGHEVAEEWPHHLTPPGARQRYADEVRKAQELLNTETDSKSPPTSQTSPWSLTWASPETRARLAARASQSINETVGGHMLADRQDDLDQPVPSSVEEGKISDQSRSVIKNEVSNAESTGNGSAWAAAPR